MVPKPNELSEGILASLTEVYTCAGHAMWNGVGPRDIYTNWIGLYGGSYKGIDEQKLYVEHIRAAVKLAMGNPKSLLIFCGGATRKSAPYGLTEALSYFRAAMVLGLLDDLARVALEEYSRDSYENYGTAAMVFRELTGRWPTRVTFVGFAFKEERLRLHHEAFTSRVKALWEFRYAGVNNPPIYRLESGRIPGEEHARALFIKDPHGEAGELRMKREDRDPYRRGNPLLTRLAA